eukprot:COSAG02_NODE_17201_length_1021_cov_1.619306_3_plen_28_part_01
MDGTIYHGITARAAPHRQGLTSLSADGI